MERHDAWRERRNALGRLCAIWALMACLSYRLVFWLELGQWPPLALDDVLDRPTVRVIALQRLVDTAYATGSAVPLELLLVGLGGLLLTSGRREAERY